MRQSLDASGPHSAGQLGPGAGLAYPGFGKLFLIWTAFGLLTSLRYQFHRPAVWDFGDLPFTLAFTACYYPWVLLTPLVFRLERAFPLGDGRWPRNLGILAALSVPFSLLASPLTLWIFSGTMSLMQPGWTPPFRKSWAGHFPMAQALYWCSVAGGYFVRTQFLLRRQEHNAARLALEKSQLETGLKQAQLEVIRARLNPHFLFNSLQNISAMTRQDPQTASRMLARLGDLLRAVLRQDSEPESTLDEEAELARAYVALERMRFGERLVVDFRIEPETRQAMVPCFLLQPLIENAVIHGLRGVGRSGLITVSARIEGRELLLSVADNGVGPPEQSLAEMKLGVGLGSTRERLGAMYPNRHSLTMERPARGGAEVRIAIPLRFAGHEDPDHQDEHPAIADR